MTRQIEVLNLNLLFKVLAPTARYGTSRAFYAYDLEMTRLFYLSFQLDDYTNF